MKHHETFHALVTGATGGIGQAVCRSLATHMQAQGRPLRLTVAGSRQSPRLDELYQELAALGVKVHALHGDVAQPAVCQSLVNQAIAQNGDLHALICVAGVSYAGRLADLSLEDWNHTFNLNTRAVWLMAQTARESLTRARGSITAVASMSGVHPHPGLGAYSPAKAALIMLCRQLAQEWGPDGIRTNSVCPGMIRTPLTEALYTNEGVTRAREGLVPVGRIGRPDDIGEAVAYLVSDAASYVNGVDLVVDGGVSDHMLAMIPGRNAKPSPPDPST